MMLKFVTRGTPSERGRQQAALCGSLAAPWFNRTLAAIRRDVGSDVIVREVALWRKRMENVYPEGHAESCAIAAAMGINADDYFAAVLSFRLLYLPSNCTAVGFYTDDGRPMFIKTDDIHAAELGVNVLETTVPDRGYRHIHFHFAGSIWTVAGMNECGLAMGMTGIPGPMLETDGLFSLDALHSILPSCATVEEAQEHIRELKLNAYGFSLTMADAGGRLAQVEKSGAGFVNLPLPSTGAFLHANTIVDPDFAARNPPQSAALRMNSERRVRNAARLLQTLPRTEAGLRALMSDRSPEGAICQAGAAEIFTDFAVLFSPLEKRLYYRAGWPDYADTGTLFGAELFGSDVPPTRAGPVSGGG